MHFTYPRCPKVNGWIERYQRTRSEEFPIAPLGRDIFLTTQVQIRPSILDRGSQFACEHLDGRNVEGVHYRVAQRTISLEDVV